MAETIELRWSEKNLIAAKIYEFWTKWDSARTGWKQEKQELREYLHATDTKKTSNAPLPWKNSTVTPKLTQIRDNLHANYMAALFPKKKWFEFQAEDNDSTLETKRTAVESYMRGKLRQQDFPVIVSRLVLDYIDYGNAFVGQEFVDEKKMDPITGELVSVYRGPRPYRISPLDICFDPTANSFAEAPCIVRRLKTIGDLTKDIETRPHLEYDPAVVAEIKDSRHAGSGLIDQYKNDGMKVDGFGDITQYVESGMIELHDFHGDIYDKDTGTWMQNRVITIADGRWVLRNVENRSWIGDRPIKHVGWRLRSDNLWAQGPLDQLIGMQYRIDHLENLKADVFDQIAHPFVTVKGSTVEEFEFGPNQKVFLGADGSVEVIRPDAAALSADNEIAILMDRMEELAGAPRQAMGIRTPGEKTKYEVQTLENGAGRIFQSKVSWFERNLVEPILNSMLEEGVRGLDTIEDVEIVDETLGTSEFVSLKKSDITAKGKLTAIGARHFAEKAQFVQELTQTMQIVESMPEVAVHTSGFAIAKALGSVMAWDSYGIIKENVRVQERAETARLSQAAQEDVDTESQMSSELQDEDMQGTEAAV